MKKSLTLILALTMLLTAMACGEVKTPPQTQAPETQALTQTPETEAPATAAPTEAPETQAPTEVPETEAPETEASGIREEFKEAMDSYESFVNDYVEFMKKYKENPDDLSLLSDYTGYLSKYTDLTQKFDAWESEDLTSEELAYYIDVQASATKKLLEVAQ